MAHNRHSRHGGQPATYAAIYPPSRKSRSVQSPYGRHARPPRSRDRQIQRLYARLVSYISGVISWQGLREASAPRSYHFLSATTHQGRTCAHLDVDRNLLETLQFLADASIDLEGRNQWGMTALQLAQSNCRHEMHVSLEARGAAVMSGNAGGRRRDARHRDPESGLTSLQEAEEQLAEAVQDVNDELISWWDPTLMRNEGTFQAKIDRRRRW